MSDDELLTLAAKHQRDDSDPYWTFDTVGLLALLREVVEAAKGKKE